MSNGYLLIFLFVIRYLEVFFLGFQVSEARRARLLIEEDIVDITSDSESSYAYFAISIPLANGWL